MARKGKWFEAFKEGAREQALELAKAKNQSAWEILERVGDYRRFYVGDQLPKVVTKQLQNLQVHVLRFWRPGKEFPS
jgi:hypothetical protein